MTDRGECPDCGEGIPGSRRLCGCARRREWEQWEELEREPGRYDLSPTEGGELEGNNFGTSHHQDPPQLRLYSKEGETQAPIFQPGPLGLGPPQGTSLRLGAAPDRANTGWNPTTHNPPLEAESRSPGRATPAPKKRRKFWNSGEPLEPTQKEGSDAGPFDDFLSGIGSPANEQISTPPCNPYQSVHGTGY